MLMKVVVGLGNPGEKYEKTRHNLGFMVVDKLSQPMANGQWPMEKKFQAEVYKLKANSYQLILVKPQTFMNNSGLVVKKITESYKLKTKSLYVVHDDLDIQLGKYKIQFGKGPHQHNGVKSVEEYLKTKDFWRVRVGVAGAHYPKIKARGGSMAEEYVLKPFAKSEQPIIQETIDKAIKELMQKHLKE